MCFRQVVCKQPEVIDNLPLDDLICVSLTCTTLHQHCNALDQSVWRQKCVALFLATNPAIEVPATEHTDEDSNIRLPERPKQQQDVSNTIFRRALLKQTPVVTQPPTIEDCQAFLNMAWSIFGYQLAISKAVLNSSLGITYSATWRNHSVQVTKKITPHLGYSRTSSRTYYDNRGDCESAQKSAFLVLDPLTFKNDCTFKSQIESIVIDPKPSSNPQENERSAPTKMMLTPDWEQSNRWKIDLLETLKTCRLLAEFQIWDQRTNSSPLFLLENTNGEVVSRLVYAPRFCPRLLS